MIALASAKTPAYTAILTADRATVQERVARVQALIQAGRHTLRATVADAWEAVQDGPRITGPTCVPMGLAASFALDASVQAVDLLYASGGTTAFRDESPLQKRSAICRRSARTPLRRGAATNRSASSSLGGRATGHSTSCDAGPQCVKRTCLCATHIAGGAGGAPGRSGRTKACTRLLTAYVSLRSTPAFSSG